MQDKRNERDFYEKMFSGVTDTSGDGYCITYGYEDIYTHTVDRVPKGTILDVACGGGKHAVNLAKKGFQVFAIELTSEGIRIAREAAKAAGVKVNFIRGDVEKMPFKDGAFDYCFCGLIFHHFPRMEKLADEVSLITKQGIFGVEPNACEPVCNLMFNVINPAIGVGTMTKNQRAIFPKRFSSMLRERGFSAININYIAIHHNKSGWKGRLIKLYETIMGIFPPKYRSNKFSFSATRK